MRRNHGYRIAILLTVFLAAAVHLLFAQQPRRLGRPPRPTMADDTTTMPGPSISRRILKASYEQIQKDALRLSELADDLKAEVTNVTNEDTLSLSTVKKAEEIEKLAKRIQSRMKNL